MVFHEDMNALILFGGIRTDVARFSQLSSLMFQFDLKSQTWAQMKLANRQKVPTRRNSFVPPERAFHSAEIMGNYMVVFGGYSHKHNEVKTS
jgi:N-acetylneuraminic acid mutarotase